MLDMKTFCVILSIFACSVSFSQNILISEDFEGANLPSGWTINSNATDGGWNLGTNQTLESQWWSIATLSEPMMMIVTATKAWTISLCRLWISLTPQRLPYSLKIITTEEALVEIPKQLLLNIR